MVLAQMLRSRFEFQSHYIFSSKFPVLHPHAPKTLLTPSKSNTIATIAKFSAPKIQNSLQASYYRGGTSRALIFHASDLPPSRTSWAPIFRGVLGSPDPNGRQLDGLGGGISSLSKICVVAPSTRADADVDYTFVQVGVKDDVVDYSGNCGNMTSAIGPWAVDQGVVKPAINESSEGREETTVRIWNTNTQKMVHSTFGVSGGGGGGEAAAGGDFAIDGVAGTADRIRLAFLNPAGSKTGKLLPTANAVDELEGVRASCIDAGNPCVVVCAGDVGIEGTILPDSFSAEELTKLEAIRRRASVAMGLSEDTKSASATIPRIAIVSPPSTHKLISGDTMQDDTIDIVVRTISTGQPHRAVPITVAMSIAAAVNIEGSTAASVVACTRADASGLTVGHPSGKLVVGSSFDESGNLLSSIVYRTARRLMEGRVFWK